MTHFPGVRISPAVAILLIAPAFLLSACGGAGGGSTTASTPSVPSAAPQTTPSQRGSAPPGHYHQSATPDPRRGFNPPASNHDSGGRAAQFETKGADNSIQESGTEASSAERHRAAIALHGYLDARLQSNWKRACSFISSASVASLAQLAGRSKPQPCAKVLASLSAGLPASALRESAIATVAAFRVEADHGFLLFHGAHGTDYFMPMARQGSLWKVAAIAPSALG